MNYEIFTDTSSNLTDEIIKKYNIKIVSLQVIVDGKAERSYVDGQKSDLQRYYGLLREKTHQITTSCANEFDFEEAFEKTLKEGKDILYVGFSSGLSETYQNAEKAALKLQSIYVDRQIITIDTLAASLGEGMLVLHACENREKGMTLIENGIWLEENKLKMAHLFTVDSLYWLHKGGRVSKLSFIIGDLAGIKPVLHQDDNGKLVPTGKVLSRKKSLIVLARRLSELIVDPENQYVAISHGDCIEDVEFLKNEVLKLIKVKGFIVNYVDPTIGAHSGPGTIAIFAMCTNR